MINILKTTLGRFRLIAFLEGLSFLILLFIAMPLKYFAHMEQAVRVVGMAHGVLFLLYMLLLIQVKIELGWGAKKTALAIVASLLPFGTFYADARWFRA